MTRQFLCLALVGSLAFPGHADSNIPTTRPEAAGMSSERLARIAPMIQGYVQRGEIAGAVTLIARRGAVVHHQAHGYMDVVTRTPMPKDALFRLASQTKPVAGVAAMIQHERAKLLLDAPASRYIEEFNTLRVAAPIDPNDPSKGRELLAPRIPPTPRHFLTHTSGLGSTGPFGLITQKDYPGPRQPGETVTLLVRRYAQAPLAFHPGEYWQYSPVAGINVVAALIEISSGKSFGEFAQVEIFEPLGMRGTHFYVPQAKLNRLPTAYRRPQNGGLIVADRSTPESRFVASGEPEVFFSGPGSVLA